MGDQWNSAIKPTRPIPPPPPLGTSYQLPEVSEMGRHQIRDWLYDNGWAWLCVVAVAAVMAWVMVGS